MSEQSGPFERTSGTERSPGEDSRNARYRDERDGNAASKRNGPPATRIDEVGTARSGATAHDRRDAGDRPGFHGVIVESERVGGSKGPFYAVYRDGDRYGLFCSNCKSIDVAMDPMGRAKCSDCDNESKPTERDLSYL